MSFRLHTSKPGESDWSDGSGTHQGLAGLNGSEVPLTGDELGGGIGAGTAALRPGQSSLGGPNDLHCPPRVVRVRGTPGDPGLLPDRFCGQGVTEEPELPDHQRDFVFALISAKGLADT
jgi:hypothetical protein